jgi:hypothetical protein
LPEKVEVDFEKLAHFEKKVLSGKKQWSYHPHSGVC